MSHGKRTIEWLKSHKGLTSKEAYDELGNTRLSATIFDLRKDGWNIASTGESGVNRFGETTHYVRYILKRPYKIKEEKKGIL